MVRAGFGVRMKMPPPLIPPPGGPNPRFSSAIPNVPSARKPRDFFGEPPALPFIRRPPPPPLMGQKSMLPPSPLKPRFFAPRDATSDFPTRPLRMRMAPRMGFGVKTNFAGGSMPRPRLAKGAAPGSVPRPRLAKAAASGSMPRPRLAKVEPPGSELLRFPPVLKATKAGKIDSKGKKKGKKKKKTYTLTKEKSLKKPWVNETLKVEIEKKFTLLEEAKTKNEPSAWDAYLVQKKLVDDINHALRLEYLGNHSDAEYPYYCETCDRGFISLNLFSAHKSQHITCGKEGCSFTGHPKIVEKHYMMQHRTGLFNRIVKGNSPEEIEKWITERKKHFPTKQKIEEKQAQRVEMEKRGERYAERKKAFNQRNNNFKTGPNNRFDKNAGNKPSSHKFKTFGGRGTFARNKSATEGPEPLRKKREPIVAEEEDCVVRNLLPFRGTAYYLNLESIISDEDSVSVMSAYSDNCSDFTNECEDDRSGENVIAEIEKDSSNFNENTEGDCLDKHFKNDVDIGISCDDESKNIDHIVVPSKDVPSTYIEDDKVTYSVTRIAPSVDPPKVAEKTVTNVNNSLALLQCYDSEDNSDEDNVVNVQNYDKSDIPPQPALVDDDDSGPDECSSKPNKPFDEEDKLVNDNANSENVSNEKSTESKKRRRKRRRDSKSEEDDIKNTEKSITEDKTPKAFHPRKRYRPPTLLEKLLAQEIKHERNVILQCVRYVVENNYFNIGSSKENIS